jgi:hypothetical protein
MVRQTTRIFPHNAFTQWPKQRCSPNSLAAFPRAGSTALSISIARQIAARVGTVREVVSRALARLQHNGLITVDGRRIIIGDENALSVFAGG